MGAETVSMKLSIWCLKCGMLERYIKYIACLFGIFGPLWLGGLVWPSLMKDIRTIKSSMKQVNCAWAGEIPGRLHVNTNA